MKLNVNSADEEIINYFEFREIICNTIISVYPDCANREVYMKIYVDIYSRKSREKLFCNSIISPTAIKPSHNSCKMKIYLSGSKFGRFPPYIFHCITLTGP